jgi:hypothetical protein
MSIEIGSHKWFRQMMNEIFVHASVHFELETMFFGQPRCYDVFAVFDKNKKNNQLFFRQ